MANDIQLFRGAGLPAGDLAKYKQELQRVQAGAPVIGGLPILKLGKDGIWRYGQTDTEVQNGSEWAINPTTFRKGFIAWAKSGGTKPLGKVLKPVLLGNLPVRDDLPDVGADWTENVSFELTCLNGDDDGKTVEYASNAMGGVEAFHTLIAHLIHQIETDPAHLVPVVSLTSQGYQHSNRSYGIKGWIEKPVFEVIEWVNNGEAPPVAEPEAEDDQQEAQPEPEQPQRRAAAPSRGAAPAREAAPARGAASERAATRGPVPARGSAIPRNAPARGAAPARGNGKPAADPEADAAATRQEQADAAGAGVVRRRRRAAAGDIPT